MTENKLTIFISDGPHQGTYHFSNFPVSIGRLEDNDLSLPKDNSISRHHCVILKKGSV